MTQIIKDILKLSIPERIAVIEAIWDSISSDAQQLGLSPETKQLLDDRLKLFDSNQDEGSSWEEVKTRINDQF
ncbi:addiction module protein [Roseimarinus sediminis]|jgi:putative addiction module component (TIGR02574 family)|uniref:addiction module protein n=1 Tax=Roseimarinus sediminis TaxID=1610899 RepID=UPI003D196571